MSDIKAISNVRAPLGRETPRNVDLSRRFISLGPAPFVGRDAFTRASNARLQTISSLSVPSCGG
jgi:hypothetical protein